MSKPSDFIKKPFGSVLQKSEAETVAANAMVILSRTGNEWRNLSYEEYETERRKDGNFSSAELMYLCQVKPYLTEDTAETFADSWKIASEPITA